MFRELNSDWRLGAKPDLLSTSCRFGWCELFMGSISADNLFYGMSDFNYRNSKMLHLNIQSLKLEFGLFYHVTLVNYYQLFSLTVVQ